MFFVVGEVAKPRGVIYLVILARNARESRKTPNFVANETGVRQANNSHGGGEVKNVILKAKPWESRKTIPLSY